MTIKRFENTAACRKIGSIRAIYFWRIRQHKRPCVGGTIYGHVFQVFMTFFPKTMDWVKWDKEIYLLHQTKKLLQKKV